MRELGRGGTLVAATIAALHNRAASDGKHRAVKKRISPLETRNALRGKLESLPSDEDEDTERRCRKSGGSERPQSTASETSERDSASVQSSEEPASASERNGPHASGDSDSPDEDTVKCTPWNDTTLGNAVIQSQSDSSSSTEADSEDGEPVRFGSAPRVIDAEYRTLTPSGRHDTSTRCDGDFRWLRSGEIATDASQLERMSIEKRPSERADEIGSGSLDRRRRKAGDRNERDRKTRSSLTTAKPPQHPASTRVSPRRSRPIEQNRQRPEESPHDLHRRWNSYEHFRGPEGGGGGGWWPMCWCHAPPPPCCARDQLPTSWLPYSTHFSNPTHAPCKNDAEERVRRLEGDKESLQLQAQVLSEQISAQAEKISELERTLHDTKQRLDDADDRLQKEMLQRSSLETQKLELLSKLSELRLRDAERGVLERSPPPPPEAAAAHVHAQHPPPPRTPPANYGRQIERNTHVYSSLPRAAQAPDMRAVAFAEKEEVIPPRGSPSPSLRGTGGSPWTRLTRAGSGGAGSGGPWLEGGELTRGGVRATAMPRLQRDHQTYPWQTINVKEWDTDTTCSWLESLSLEVYAPAARAWLGATPDARGVIATATPHTIEKELALKHPMHRKKIVLALMDLQGGHGDSYLTPAGRLDTTWVLRWVEDAGLAGARDAVAEAALDGRTLHRLTHDELHHHLRVHTLLHALSVRRGIQVLRESNFSAESMIRRGREPPAEGEEPAPEVESDELARWSSHRVMQWLKQIDLAEYAPNLRGAGVHGGLMLHEPRFTAELLATLLNIPASKTLLRRHLTQRFNELLGRDVIQQKRIAEQTLGYQPLTITSKYKVPKKSQFSLKRKKSKDELELGELVCPLRDDCSGDISHASTMNSKSAAVDVSAACQPPDTRTH